MITQLLTGNVGCSLLASGPRFTVLLIVGRMAATFWLNFNNSGGFWELKFNYQYFEPHFISNWLKC